MARFHDLTVTDIHKTIRDAVVVTLLVGHAALLSLPCVAASEGSKEQIQLVRSLFRRQGAEGCKEVVNSTTTERLQRRFVSEESSPSRDRWCRSRSLSSIRRKIGRPCHWEVQVL